VGLAQQSGRYLQKFLENVDVFVFREEQEVAASSSETSVYINLIT
jgi:hypothetical protein